MAELRCPIGVRCASGEARRRAQCDAVSWAERVGLVRDRTQRAWAGAWNVAEFAGRVYGEATDLSLAAQWIMWMDVIDDVVESMDAPQMGAVLRPVATVLDGGGPGRVEPAVEPLVAAFVDLWRRTRRGMSSTWQSRMAHAWTTFADTMPWEVANRARRQPPALEDYFAHRSTAGGVDVALVLTDGLCQQETPDIVFHCGPLVTLRMLASEHICWVNDLYSLDREETKGDVHNLVLVLEHHRGHDRRGAVRETVRMVNERMRAITHLAGTVPDYQRTMRLSPRDCHRLDQAVDRILQWVAGSMDFHHISTRHLDHHNPRPNPFPSPPPGDPETRP